MIEDRRAPEADSLAAVRELLEGVDAPFIFARYADDGGANVCENVETTADWMKLAGAVVVTAIGEVRRREGIDAARAFVERFFSILPTIPSHE